MDPKLRELLCRLLKLNADTKEEDVLKAVDTAAGQLATLSVTLPAVDGQKTALEALAQKVTALSAELVGVRKDMVLADAARDGKVIPLAADAVAKMDLATLTELVSKLPAGVVPLAAKTPDKVQTPESQTDDAALDTVARGCGLDPKKVREANKGK